MKPTNNDAKEEVPITTSNIVKKETILEKSVFEQAIHRQEHQFQTGIENLKKEIESILQLKSKFTPVIGNRATRFLNRKSRFY